MKFKYIGDLPVKDVDLVVGGVFKSSQVILKGTVFEVPDDNPLLIQRIKLNGNYEELPKQFGSRLKKEKKAKNEKKKEKNKEEK